MRSVLQIMRRANVIVALLVASVFVAMPSQAQELTESHLAAAKEAMQATGATTRLDGILVEVASFTKAGLIATRPDIEGDITQIVDEAAISLAPRRGPLEDEVATIYANVFTEDELKTISGFFGSETGAKFLNETPFLFRQVDEASKVWRTGITRDLSQMVQEKLKEKGLQ